MDRIADSTDEIDWPVYQASPKSHEISQLFSLNILAITSNTGNRSRPPAFLCPHPGPLPLGEGDKGGGVNDYGCMGSSLAEMKIRQQESGRGEPKRMRA
jgi:hypothetical protein